MDLNELRRHPLAGRVLLGVVGTVLVAGMVAGFGEAMRGDTGEVTPAPTVTVTKTVTPTPKPSLLPNARSSAEDGATALTRISVETAWRKMPAGQRVAVCDAWHTDRYTALEAFMEGANGAGAAVSLDSATVARVFDEKCGAP